MYQLNSGFLFYQSVLWCKNTNRLIAKSATTDAVMWVLFARIHLQVGIYVSPRRRRRNLCTQSASHRYVRMLMCTKIELLNLKDLSQKSHAIMLLMLLVLRPLLINDCTCSSSVLGVSRSLLIWDAPKQYLNQLAFHCELIIIALNLIICYVQLYYFLHFHKKSIVEIIIYKVEVFYNF